MFIACDGSDGGGGCGGGGRGDDDDGGDVGGGNVRRCAEEAKGDFCNINDIGWDSIGEILNEANNNDDDGNFVDGDICTLTDGLEQMALKRVFVCKCFAL